MVVVVVDKGMGTSIQFKGQLRDYALEWIEGNLLKIEE